MRLKRPDRGFVLLLVVLLLLIVALTTASVINRSLAGVIEAYRAEEQLRDRWARLSIHRSVLERASKIFDSHESNAASGDKLSHILKTSYVIGKRNYVVVLADESAKLNLLEGIRQGRGTATLNAAQSLGVRLRSDVVEKLSDFSRDRFMGESAWPIRSWSSLLERTSIRKPEDAKALCEQTKWVTLWGNGTLNGRRSSPEVQNAHRFLYGPLSINAGEPRGAEMKTAISDKSSCYSAWVISEHPSGSITYTVQWSDNGSFDREGFAW